MTFFTFDDDEVPRDTLDVLAASAVLEITEFRLFELAYERWFGTEPLEVRVEPYFNRYMFTAAHGFHGHRHMVVPWCCNYYQIKVVPLQHFFPGIRAVSINFRG